MTTPPPRVRHLCSLDAGGSAPPLWAWRFFPSPRAVCLHALLVLLMWTSGGGGRKVRYRTKQLNSARTSEKHRKDDRDTVNIYFSSAWFLNPVRCQLRIIKHGEGSINAIGFVGKSVIQRSPIFLAPETSFVEDDFPQNWGGGMVSGWSKLITLHLWFLDDVEVDDSTSAPPQIIKH